MAFKLENFGAEVANAKSTLGGICYYRYFNKENDTLTTAGYFPATLGLEVGDRIRVIPSVKTDADEIYIVTSTANRTVTVKQIDTDGAVDSVNGKTGTVVLNASDVGALPDSTVIPDATQVSELPTASATEEGKIYQFTGTTTASYTNGYFYKCVSDGQNPATYSWTQVNVQPQGSSLPSQTGNAGKFLTTDGTDASWGNAVQNLSTAEHALTVLGTATTKKNCINIGYNSEVSGNDVMYYHSVAIGSNSKSTGGRSVAVGGNTQATSDRSIAIGFGVKATADNAIQLGYSYTNSTADTFCVSNSHGNFMIMDANGHLPAARHAALPSADGTYVLKLVISSGVPTLSWVAE